MRTKTFSLFLLLALLTLLLSGCNLPFGPAAPAAQNSPGPGPAVVQPQGGQAPVQLGGQEQPGAQPSVAQVTLPPLTATAAAQNVPPPSSGDTGSTSAPLLPAPPGVSGSDDAQITPYVDENDIAPVVVETPTPYVEGGIVLDVATEEPDLPVVNMLPVVTDQSPQPETWAGDQYACDSPPVTAMMTFRANVSDDSGIINQVWVRYRYVNYPYPPVLPNGYQWPWHTLSMNPVTITAGGEGIYEVSVDWVTEYRRESNITPNLGLANLGVDYEIWARDGEGAEDYAQGHFGYICQP